MADPAHEVYVICTCPDPDQCATNDLVQDRNSGWKEAFRLRRELRRCQEAERDQGVSR